ncbi:uncharacterized protein LOC122046463 isoform X1 [Zingiber officinale]|uniref:uncharacterized protein LOC122046463 isoform X1 n=1 Tax=Zingiber officinale TaxID=94328 RepID=UPI001C4DAA9C|nr:uncharacterized protein LOC122046463 isoform X1 [Zingiber officinale]
MVCPKVDKINEALTEMAEQQMRLSMGILIDIVDDEWMRDTLPDDDIPLPSVMADKADDAEDSRNGLLDVHFSLQIYRELGEDSLPG